MNYEELFKKVSVDSELPDGDYLVEFTEFEWRLSKNSGNDMIMLKYKVVEAADEQHLNAEEAMFILLNEVNDDQTFKKTKERIRRFKTILLNIKVPVADTLDESLKNFATALESNQFIMSIKTNKGFRYQSIRLAKA